MAERVQDAPDKQPRLRYPALISPPFCSGLRSSTTPYSDLRSMIYNTVDGR